MSNPLQKYFRQPKLFITLPSKGAFYTAGSFEGDPTNVPVFAMTGMDEIIMKTPDALFSGEATVNLIQSCCPSIKDAHKVPSLDVDALLVAIRLATYGEHMTIGHSCKNCGEDNEFEISLTSVLDHYQNKEFNNLLQIDDLTLTLRPLTYEEMSHFNIENFKLQKMLNQLVGDTFSDEQRQTHLDDIYRKLAAIQLEVFVTSIESIQTPESVVTEKEYIVEWLTNSAKPSYHSVKKKLEENKDYWALPSHKIKCVSCDHEDSIEVGMDQSSFFD